MHMDQIMEKEYTMKKFSSYLIFQPLFSSYIYKDLHILFLFYTIIAYIHNLLQVDFLNQQYIIFPYHYKFDLHFLLWPHSIPLHNWIIAHTLSSFISIFSFCFLIQDFSVVFAGLLEDIRVKSDISYCFKTCSHTLYQFVRKTYWFYLRNITRIKLIPVISIELSPSLTWINI